MKRLAIVCSLLVPGLLVAASATMWIDPVLMAIERYGLHRIADFGGTLPGIAVDNANRLDITTIDDVSPSDFKDAVTSEEKCAEAATWLCTNKADTNNVKVHDVVVWDGLDVKYCVARCRVNSATYAFVMVVGR